MAALFLYVLLTLSTFQPFTISGADSSVNTCCSTAESAGAPL